MLKVGITSSGSSNSRRNKEGDNREDRDVHFERMEAS